MSLKDSMKIKELGEFKKYSGNMENRIKPRK
jgi:hypothetical protein